VVVAGGSGRAVAFRVAPGQAHGLPRAVPLLDRLPGVPLDGGAIKGWSPTGATPATPSATTSGTEERDPRSRPVRSRGVVVRSLASRRTRHGTRSSRLSPHDAARSSRAPSVERGEPGPCRPVRLEHPKTVAKWRQRATTADQPMGPSRPRGTVLTEAEEAIVVGFRRRTLPPLDDVLGCRREAIPDPHPQRPAPLPAAARHLPPAAG
jgi:hypothetical protein